MSTTDSAGTDGTLARKTSDEPSKATVEAESLPCRPTDAIPVEIDAKEIESTAKPYLQDLKSTLLSNDRQPAHVVVEATFDEPGSIPIHSETDRLRRHLLAASFLGAGRVTVEIDAVSNPARVAPALSAIEERARREGIALSVSVPEGVTVSA
ncbi:Xylose isomerase-like TIM barrel [Halalkaliarchaeum sp. AArc-CO]|uniref:hypothetical protein n=1 Tax=unclassified Halalkaliarchaeum TaxID=2678344 RepID=UPI00217D3D23|nr:MULTISPECIES: hypothetical protein [unclassified Halalkaliarchaeum]MDR5674399.1 hypothetical protein [Halalkaliarchaeum sp. AArc-GB]UWG52214.1 Xylose isomerase-like TIM barrel [Halalkaliarchaeum sp. AArc-CO]